MQACRCLTPLGSRGRNLSDGVFCTGLAPEQHGKVLAQFAALELGCDEI